MHKFYDNYIFFYYSFRYSSELGDLLDKLSLVVFLPRADKAQKQLIHTIIKGGQMICYSVQAIKRMLLPKGVKYHFKVSFTNFCEMVHI